MTLREELLELSGVLLENKDYLINKLDMTDDEKNQVMAFFHKHPEAESKIDWNRKDIKFDDFKPLLSSEGKSNNAIKKYGLPGLTKGKDYDIIEEKPGFTVYIPYNHTASKVIASNNVSPALGNGAKWCISHHIHKSYWDNYTTNNKDVFAFICDENKKEKWAIEYHIGGCYAWDWEDKRHEVPKEFEYIKNYLGEHYEAIRKKYDESKNREQQNIEKIKAEFLSHPIAEVNEKGYCRLPDYITEEDRKKITKLIIPDNTEFIAYSAFSGCTNLTTMTLPSHIKRISADAFYNCQSLTDINIPDSVSDIGDNTFRGCANLNDIELSDNIISIGAGAFAYCKSLKSIKLPKQLKEISFGVFEGCNNLVYIEIPDSVKKIRAGAFDYCTRLKSVSIPKDCSVEHQEDWYGKLIVNSKVNKLELHI